MDLTINMWLYGKYEKYIIYVYTLSQDMKPIHEMGKAYWKRQLQVSSEG